MPWLINAAQIEKFRKFQKNILIFDATLHVHEGSKDPQQEFLEHHIIGARFFDIDAFSNPHSSLPHTLIQDPELISEKLGALGISNDTRIIFYDNSSHHTSCRALWMLKMFGHRPDQLYIYDGNLASWEKYGGKIESGEAKVKAKTYKTKWQSELIRSLDQMKTNLLNPTEQIVDVRHAVRFAGGAEPRPGLRAGHIPESYSFPFNTLFDRQTNRWKPIDKIRTQLVGIGVDLKSPIVTTCGSGITAPILNFALDLMGQPIKHSVYDGSWSEWGANHLYPGELSVEERPVVSSLDVIEPE